MGSTSVLTSIGGVLESNISILCMKISKIYRDKQKKIVTTAIGNYYRQSCQFAIHWMLLFFIAFCLVDLYLPFMDVSFKQINSCKKRDVRYFTWIGSVNFMTGFNSGKMYWTKSGPEASSEICRTTGNTNGTIWAFTNSLARHGTTRCNATLRHKNFSDWSGYFFFFLRNTGTQIKKCHFVG